MLSSALRMNQSLISGTQGPRRRDDREKSWPMYIHQLYLWRRLSRISFNIILWCCAWYCDIVIWHWYCDIVILCQEEDLTKVKYTFTSHWCAVFGYWIMDVILDIRFCCEDCLIFMTSILLALILSKNSIYVV